MHEHFSLGENTLPFQGVGLRVGALFHDFCVKTVTAQSFALTTPNTYLCGHCAVEETFCFSGYGSAGWSSSGKS